MVPVLTLEGYHEAQINKMEGRQIRLIKVYRVYFGTVV